MRTIILTITLSFSILFAQGITNTLGGDTSSDQFIVENNSGTGILTATGDGKVGIGLANPMRILDVDGSISLRTGTQANSGMWLTNTSGVEEWFVGTTNNAGVNQAGFYKGGWRLIVEDYGNIGVGTTFPSEKLTVKMGGTTWGSPHFALEASGSTNKWDFTVGGADKLYIGYNESSKVVVQPDGKVGIGTTSPNADLQVNGDVKIGENGSVFQEIRHIQGTFPSGSRTVTIALPTGFNSVNTRVLSYEVESGTGKWFGQGHALQEEHIYYTLEGSQLTLWVPGFNDYFTGKPYRLVIMRF